MNKKYDVIIIGGGIGGLVCGCYLSKAGLKVLVLEKNKQAGGYCRSVNTPDGLRFDTCIHSLASCRIDGTVGKILDEIDLRKELIINTSDVPNIVFCGNRKIKFYRDIKKTIDEFSFHFPSERKNISVFFDYILNSPALTFSFLRNKTFYQYLKEQFNDELLVKIIAEMVLISTGVFSDALSAFVGCSTLREYIFDAGYYPVGGVQAFPNALIKRILDAGGVVICGETVNEILVKNGKVRGVLTANKNEYVSRFVVSSCDITQTLTKLIHDDKVNSYWQEKTNKMMPSMSSFCAYLGVKNTLEFNADFQSTIYFMNDNRDLSATYDSINNYNNSAFILSSPTYLGNPSWNARDGDLSFLLLTNTYFKNEEFWLKNKNVFADRLIDKLRNVFPYLVEAIYFRGQATPHTLHGWTFNFNGASYGWASIPAQVADVDLTSKSQVEGLFFAGHWLTLSHGIISAAYTGKRAAKAILNITKRELDYAN